MVKPNVIIGGLVLVAAIGGGLYYANKKGYLDSLKGGNQTTGGGSGSNSSYALGWDSRLQYNVGMIFFSAQFSYTGDNIPSGFDMQALLFDDNNGGKLLKSINRHFGLQPTVISSGIDNTKIEGFGFPVQSGGRYHVDVKVFDGNGKLLSNVLTDNISIP